LIVNDADAPDAFYQRTLLLRW